MTIFKEVNCSRQKRINKTSPMKNNHLKVVVCLYLLFTGLNISLGQSGPEFLDCSSDPVSFVSDDFVFANNYVLDIGRGDSIEINGDVETYYLKPVEKVEVTLTSPGHVYPTYITDKDGKFHFTLPDSEAYTINCYRNDFFRNGVSSLDLIRIQKHLLGVEPITNPYDLIAADANHSESVSAIDLIELRKLILGIYTVLPSNTSWRFVPRDFISGATHFIGIKVGDVNNTVKANFQNVLPRGSRPPLTWRIDQKEFFTGDLIEINFYLKNPIHLQGFQFTITDPDLEFLDVSSSSIDLGPEDFAMFNDKITMSWFSEKGIQFSDKDVVFTLKARAKLNGSLRNNLSINSDITEAEMYNTDNEIFIPRLVIEDKFNPIISSSPEPNPWKDESAITFYLSHSGIATFDIYDLNGRVIFTKTESFNIGKNIIRIYSTDFPERGLLFYAIKTEDNVISNKMIVIN